MSDSETKAPAEGCIIVIDEERCTGCGLCEELALENIEVPLRTDRAVVTKQPSTVSQWQDCLQAVADCPAEGISVVDLAPTGSEPGAEGAASGASEGAGAPAVPAHEDA